MNIVMVTNTYTPHVGGVARSVSAFSEEYRRRGHRVLVVAPEFGNRAGDGSDVVRIPAIQNFNGSDFSVVLPVRGLLTEALNGFGPHIVHAHHPYLLGMTALRIARYRELPLVFTHHTLYERYTHYVPGDSPTLARFVIELATRYANLADRVFAPSESIAALIRERGVTAPVTVVPTGVDLDRFARGDGARFRAGHGIPRHAFVVGHVGRLAPEKNLEFLAQALARFLSHNDDAHLVVAGSGPSERHIRAAVARVGHERRLHLLGVLDHARLSDAYHAMDAFAFASKTETQGMVLTEAMAARVPVVALEASGVREVVEDERNGRLLREENAEVFASALQWLAGLPPQQRQALREAARRTAQAFSLPATATRALDCYEVLRQQAYVARPDEFEQWQRTLKLIKTEWEIVKGMAGAAGVALGTAELPEEP
ncbi:MAG: glycosyltransferase [Gammaproteobacteria bacterium]|jgi:glycosyltransferase involved in cell wall biosynthesis